MTIHAEIRDGEWVTPYLLEAVIDFNNPQTLNLTFGNRFRLQTPEFTFADLYAKTTKLSGAVGSNFDDLIKPTRSGALDEFQDFINSSLNVTKNNIVSADNQAMIWDEHGIWGRKVVNNGYSPEQFKMSNSLLVFTDDNWLSCKAAIGKITLGNAQYYGLLAEAVVGQIVASNQLWIMGGSAADNSNYYFKMDSAGLSIKLGASNSFKYNASDGLVINNGDGKFALTKNACTLTNVKLTVSNANNTQQVVIDPTQTTIFAVRTKKPNIDNSLVDRLYIDAEGNLTMSGKLSAATGDFSGAISASSGTIGGWTIGADYMSYGGTRNPQNNAWATTPTNYISGNTGITATIGSVSRTNLLLKIGSNFGIASDGTAYLSSAVISGTVTASELFAIGDYYINSTMRVGAVAIGKSNYAINVGTTTGQNPTTVSTSNFSVDYYGNMIAKTGQIGGWKIGADILTSDDDGTITLKSGASAYIAINGIRLEPTVSTLINGKSYTSYATLPACCVGGWYFSDMGMSDELSEANSTAIAYSKYVTSENLSAFVIHQHGKKTALWDSALLFDVDWNQRTSGHEESASVSYENDTLTVSSGGALRFSANASDGIAFDSKAIFNYSTYYKLDSNHKINIVLKGSDEWSTNYQLFVDEDGFVKAWNPVG